MSLRPMDYFTKWYEAYAIPDQEAETVADTLSAMCKCLGIKKTHATPERFNRTLAQQLAILTSEHKQEWNYHLPLILRAYRSAVQDSLHPVHVCPACTVFPLHTVQKKNWQQDSIIFFH